MTGQEMVRAILKCNTCKSIITDKDGGFFHRNEKFCETCDKTSRSGWKKASDYKVVYMTDCLYCGSEIEVDGMDPKGSVCPQCHKTHPGREGVAKLVSFSDIADNFADPGVILKHPANLFSAETQVKADAGVSAIFVRGTDAVVLDSSLRPFQMIAEESVVSGRLLFVRHKIDHTFNCGTQDPLPVTSMREHLSCDVRCAASINVDVVDVVTFARWANFEPCTVGQLAKEGASPDLSGYVSRLFIECAQAALDKAVLEQGLLINMLEAHKTMILGLFKDEFSGRAREIGLSVSIPQWRGFAVKERAVANRLKDRVERLVSWNTSEIEVHAHDDKSLSARVIVEGTAQLRLQNVLALLSTADGDRWNNPECSDDEAARTLGSRIGAGINADMHELLQRIIDDTKVPVAQLDLYLPYIQGQVQKKLEGDPLLLERGLSVESVTVSVRTVSKSNALKMREAADTAVSEGRITKEMRDNANATKIDIERSASEVRMKMGQIQVDEAGVAYSQEKTLHDIEAQKRFDALHRQSAFERAEHEYSLGKMNLAAERQRLSDTLAHRQQMDQLSRRKEASDFAARTEWEKKIVSLDQAYEEWQRRNALQRAQEQAQIDRDSQRQSHRLEMQRKENAAGRAEEVEDSRLEAAVHQVFLGIEESNLAWQEKLDTYARIRDLTAAYDELDLYESRQKMDIDLTALCEKNNLAVSRESLEQLELQLRYEEERQERIRKANFSRDMEQQRFETSVQIEILQMEMERDRARRDFELQLQKLQQENTALRMQLEHAQRVDQNRTIREKQQLDADVSIAKAAYDYSAYQQTSAMIGDYQKNRISALENEKNQLKNAEGQTAQMLLQLEEQHRREQAEFFEKNQDRIEKLYTAVLNLEMQREEMRSRAEWNSSHGKNRAEAEGAHKVDGKKIDEMFRYIKKVAEDLHKLAGASAQTAAPAYTAHHAVKYCPKCGAALDLYRINCPGCGARVQ